MARQAVQAQASNSRLTTSHMMAADSLRRGLTANYLGKAFCALLALVTLPVLYRQLGAEAFGLFGLFFTVQALLGTFDFGVGAALQRDLAALQARSNDPRPADVLATLTRVELILWVIALLACAVAWLVSPFFVNHWLVVNSLPVSVVERSLVWMAIAAALQLLGSFYIGCLNGLRHHTQTNIIQSAVWALRFVLLMLCVQVGVAAAGSMSLSVLQVLQAWAAANAVLVVWAKFRLKTALPMPSAAIGIAYLAKAARFGLPLVAATTLIMLFNQVDKVAASRLVPLEVLGKFTIVWSVAEVMYLMYQPIYTSFLPLFAARFVGASDELGVAELSSSISLAWQMMCVAVLPVATVCFALSSLVITAWTGDANLSSQTEVVLRWVITGSAINAFLFIPFALQQAAGDMRPWTWRIGAALLVYAPLAVAAINVWGMPGAAAAWCIGSICLAAWLAKTTFNSLAGRGLSRLALKQLLAGSLKTLLICAVVSGLFAWLPMPSNRYAAMAFVLIALGVCMLAALRSQPAVWMLVTSKLRDLQAPQSSDGKA